MIKANKVISDKSFRIVISDEKYRIVIFDEKLMMFYKYL